MSENNNISKSIWNENPRGYYIGRMIFSTFFTIFYPFLFYVVIFHSPKSFGSLKGFLLLHVVAITCQWLSSFIFINFWTFVPSKITRIDGILVGFVDEKILYRATYFFNSVTSSSCLLLFWNRIFTILNMYRGSKSKTRRATEILVYLVTVGFICSIVVTLRIPEQEATKRIVRTISPFYPDCLDVPEVIVIVVPYPETIQKSIIIFSTYLFLSSLGTILTARSANYLLSKRMKNQSARTLKMHKKLNKRTLIQVLVDNLFYSLPFLISNFATFFQWKVPELTYFVDLLTKNNPTACFFVVFFCYDPYYKWFRKSVDKLIRFPGTSTQITIVKFADN